ncbi:Crp/Fnr family transcriptional regulator [Jannaschia seosinensis]|nr:cyclic nucleotide-binding domain-containing protein [Jannaschia seosinensis]
MLVEMLGWLAATFTFGAYAMKTMLPLRCFAIAANVFFIAYSAILWIYPTLALHILLLPFNVLRLNDLLRQKRDVHRARVATDFPPGLKGYLEPISLAPDTYLFRKGDPADKIYFVESGCVRLDEIDRNVEAGQIFGELAFFSEKRCRTLSARSVGSARILAMDETDFMALYYQNPAFGFYVVRLMAHRLVLQAP